MKAVVGIGYILIGDKWVPIDPEKMTFPYEATKDKTDGEYKPLEFLINFLQMNKIDKFLITDNIIEIEE